METVPQLSLILQTGEAGDQTCDPFLQGKWIVHYTKAAPIYFSITNINFRNLVLGNVWHSMTIKTELIKSKIWH